MNEGFIVYSFSFGFECYVDVTLILKSDVFIV